MIGRCSISSVWEFHAGLAHVPFSQAMARVVGTAFGGVNDSRLDSFISWLVRVIGLSHLAGHQRTLQVQRLVREWAELVA